MGGWRITKPRGWPACWPTRRAATAGGGFDAAQKEAIVERLHQPPGEEARREAGATASSPPPSRWTLRTIRVSVPELADYSLSGAWRVLARCRVHLRAARLQMYSPDPEYQAKVAYLEDCLRAVVREPERRALLFLDEMGYTRWPDAARDWMLGAPAAPTRARRAGPNNRQQRIVGALNALTGQVDFLDDYLVGRKQLGIFYRQLDRVYAWAERVYLVEDNWSIHAHPDVQAVLTEVPRLEVVWLPTYAPWLNPIEKLWRWLREDLLKLHQLADDWPTLRGRVNAFLEQFAGGSPALLRYTGLSGDGHLASVLRSA
jgi:transposase